MPGLNPADRAFLNKLTEILTENLSNENFGVSELAGKTGMSRSNLLRKIKKLTNLSASQFIRELRLRKAMELLKQSPMNVSEVCWEVGFSSTSYFIKCFREYYGYPPGEVGKREEEEIIPEEDSQPEKKKRIPYLISAGLLICLSIVLLVVFNPFLSQGKKHEKSIAVLPFINDSNDSTNVYIINGLMESVLGNLQKIEDLRVISRTSVEKYRNAPRTIPEMGKELNVKYFVEGSGQKIGDQILLTVQLIEASTDKHLWSRQYNRETKDIFALQMEVAKNIASEIEAIITPEEKERIEKIPTDDLVAYDYFLKGRDFLYRQTREGLIDAVTWFKKATKQDNEFALAYADMAISYYYMEIFKPVKIYTDTVNYYADQALLYDPKLPESLIAKALVFMNNADYEQAAAYLEKALEYNPNSAIVINRLSDLYANYIPNTEKYLEYALKGIRLDIAGNDSTTTSYIYLHVSNAFIQSGFIDEARRYIGKSLDHNPQNIYSQYVKAYIQYARNENLNQLNTALLKTLKMDTTRLDVLQEVGKSFYYLRDYKNACKYYKKFLTIKKTLNWDVYPAEDIKMALAFGETGDKKESDHLLQNYKLYVEQDQSIYKYLSLAVYDSFMGNTKSAIEQLKLFSKEEHFTYWTILFLKIDPLVDPIKNQSEFKNIMNKLDKKFREQHEKIKTSLENEGLL